ncbi:RrF2 family transcriptional regulator [Clostridium folliculivorans]|uniref:Rrf2 family transcriptional regulator n=1 Tax=Clostridium folliculivorans TaxID=2886038 RepID=A0A9W5Y0C7_9CLOT|nr:Rrf2 family transcriptional regulator [Clostridium folliculivorans]GKU24185.1 Rrf2 family transcriptional regulator [Clostridium folliculivorans]GKU30290.1 Rrf2 family transcriptional regulator [Clostridium folliculivorans]
MRYTKATNYALHTVAYMIAHDKTDNLVLQTLAQHLNISSTYLSKILTQLVKAGLVQSTPGVNGGYVLRKKKEAISFLDVIKAIEGAGALFDCGLHEEDSECRILKVMNEAEDVMENYLQNKKIYEILQHKQEIEVNEE